MDVARKIAAAVVRADRVRSALHDARGDADIRRRGRVDWFAIAQRLTGRPYDRTSNGNDGADRSTAAQEVAREDADIGRRGRAGSALPYNGKGNGNGGRQNKKTQCQTGPVVNPCPYAAQR